MKARRRYQPFNGTATDYRLLTTRLQSDRLRGQFDLLAVDDVEVAGHLVTRLHLAQHRGLALADFLGVIAPGRERAHVRQVHQIGWKSPDRIKLAADRVETGDRFHQAQRVRVARVAEQLV